ncbi:hypothetical protein HHK36_014280 [Tetracentron sinense]|uniref:Uncharacterized protein n=1 Tax=Tetracentron sinense TaxID=13715 RepID=A0A834Z7Q6_TETSI|nr:hypothetical protein HHK36_014280 [Tetracentron sinense]
MASSVTLEELRWFHSIDRELYARLVMNLRRDPGQSMQVIAFWIWLEQAGCENIVKKLLTLSNSLVNAVADEAIILLAFLQNDSDLPSPPPRDNDIHLTLSLARNDLSLQFLHEHRLTAISGVSKVVNDVCIRAFQDIVQQALASGAVQPRVRSIGEGSSSGVMPMGGEGSSVQRVIHGQAVIVQGGMVIPDGGCSAQDVMHMMSMPSPFLRPVTPIPFGHGSRFSLPSVIGGPSGMSQQFPSTDHYYSGFLQQATQVMPSVHPHSIEDSGRSNLNPNSQPWNINEEVPQDERTMFITFSRGYRISEGEVRDFFTSTFGDCIESIYMQEVPSNVQPLFARVVIRSAAMIQAILDGKDKAKFTINGKHVWTRLFVPKRNRMSPPPPPPPPPPAAV